MIGIKWLTGTKAMVIMCAAIIGLGAEIGLLIGLTIMFLDIIHERVRPKGKDGVLSSTFFEWMGYKDLYDIYMRMYANQPIGYRRYMNSEWETLLRRLREKGVIIK